MPGVRVTAPRATASRTKSNDRVGFAAFKADIKDRIIQELPKDCNQRTRTALMGAEITKRWNNLPNRSREIWSSQA